MSWCFSKPDCMYWRRRINGDFSFCVFGMNVIVVSAASTFTKCRLCVRVNSGWWDIFIPHKTRNESVGRVFKNVLHYAKNHHSKRIFFMFYRQTDRQSYNLQQYNITSEEKLHWQSHPCPFMEFFTHVCFLSPPWAAQSRFVSCSRLRKYLPTCIPHLLICFPKAVPAGQGGGRWVNTRLSNPSFWNAECTQLDERHRQNCSVETPSTPWHNAVKQIAFLQRFVASACPRCTRLHLSHKQPLFHPESWTPAATEAEILPRIPLKL